MSETSTPARGPGGLSTEEAARRLEQHGANELPGRASRSVWSRVLGQLRDPMSMLLLAAACVTVAVGDVPDTVVIGLVLVVNSAIGVVQEVRADRSIAELGRLAAPVARVVRDGEVVERPGPELVPDDMVLLDAGDVVPADAVLTECHALQVDESAMTGESQPVDRRAGEELSSGTVVTRGRAVATVLRTGAASGLGQVAALIAAAGTVATPLQRRLRRLSRELVVLVVVASVVVFALGVSRGTSASEMLIAAVSLSVAAVPESLPAVVSVSLALGAHRMAQRSALVRRLPAVETLGSVTVLASDKTGTLTEGQMVATGAWTPPDRSYDVTGRGYAPTGDVVGLGEPEPRDMLDRLLRDAVLCNDARLVEPHADGNDDWTPSGDPLEAALLVLAHKGGADPDRVRDQWTRVRELPFEADRGWMSTTHRCADGGWLTVVKGAPEAVLGMVRGAYGEELAAAHAATQRLAEQGCRVLALADVPAPGVEVGRLELVGLVGVADPPRAASRAVVDACRDAGIRVVLVTGDHPETARAVGAAVGVYEPGTRVLTGDDIAAGRHSDELDAVGVYARIRPEQKVRIVGDLQERGHVVAMTGDGVNDAPALRTADIGVAMGKGGTEVARQAADLVLADDDLHTIVVAVEEGRRVFGNIRSFLRFGVSGGLAEIVVMLMGPFLGMALPLLPAQILWINMLTHGVPGVAFAAEPVAPAAMRQPSRSPRESVLGQGLGIQIALLGGLISAVSVLAGFGAEWRGVHVQTAIFLALGMAQLGVALALRTRVRRTWRQRQLELAVVGAAALQLLAVYLAPLQELLGTRSLPAEACAQLLLLAAVPGVGLRLVGTLRRSRG